MPGSFRVPPALMNEFLTNFRVTGEGIAGTRKVDIAAFKKAIAATLGKPAVMEGLVTQALKNAQIKMK